MAVSILYKNPTTATDVAPVVSGTLPLWDSVTAQVIASADGDTTATITHNLAMTAADLTAGRPEVYVTQLISQALTALSAWAVTTIAANTVVLTKLASTGSGNASPQIQVTIKRPHSIGR